MYYKFYLLNVMGHIIPPQLYIGMYILIVGYIQQRNNQSQSTAPQTK